MFVLLLQLYWKRRKNTRLGGKKVKLEVGHETCSNMKQCKRGRTAYGEKVGKKKEIKEGEKLQRNPCHEKECEKVKKT